MQCFRAMSDMGVASSCSNYFDFRHHWYSLVPWNISMSVQVFCIVTTVTFIFKEIKSGDTNWPKITSDSYIQTVQWIMELSFICFRPVLQTEYPQQNFIGSVFCHAKLDQYLQFIGTEFPGSLADLSLCLIGMCIIKVCYLAEWYGLCPSTAARHSKFSGVLAVRGPGFLFLSCTSIIFRI
jgi:hypothetical protein